MCFRKSIWIVRPWSHTRFKNLSLVGCPNLQQNSAVFQCCMRKPRVQSPCGCLVLLSLCSCSWSRGGGAPCVSHSTLGTFLPTAFECCRGNQWALWAAWVFLFLLFSLFSFRDKKKKSTIGSSVIYVTRKGKHSETWGIMWLVHAWSA